MRQRPAPGQVEKIMSRQGTSGSYAKERIGVADPIGAAMIEAGFVANEYLLSINCTVEVSSDIELDGQWALPSNLFRFPIETHRPEGDRERVFGLMHPALAEHPFVKHFEQVMGFQVPREPACNGSGYSAAAGAAWRHACDLGCAGLWRELVQTRQFTTDASIFRAIAFALGYANKDDPLPERLRSIRWVMRELGSEQPADQAAVIRTLMKPSPCSDENGKTRWPINEGIPRDAETAAWAYILGVENGWFEFCGAFLNWSAAGRQRYEAGDAGVVERGAQVSFVF
jgi:hypothetical protein